MWLGVDHSRICNITQIDMFFLDKIKKIVDFEKVLEASVGDIEILKKAKKMGFCDKYLGMLWKMTEDEIYALRRENNIYPGL